MRLIQLPPVGQDNRATIAVSAVNLFDVINTALLASVAPGKTLQPIY